MEISKDYLLKAKCERCGRIYKRSRFNNRTKQRFCSPCSLIHKKERAQEEYQKNIEQKREYGKEYYQKNKEAEAIKRKEYYKRTGK